MFFRQFLHEDKFCLSYMVGCASFGVVSVIDPQLEIKTYLETAQKYGLKITHIFETHVQADHYSGGRKLSYASSAPVYFHENAKVIFPHQKLQDGQLLKIGNRYFKIIHTPGHTNDSITLLVDDWFILTGDTLFVGDVGRVDLSLESDPNKNTINARALYKSIFHKLIKLPDYVEIYPGHYGGSSCGKHMDGKPSSTIGYEKVHNFMLQVRSENAFKDILLKDVPQPPASFQKIKQSNLGRD